MNAESGILPGSAFLVSIPDRREHKFHQPECVTALRNKKTRRRLADWLSE
ncbi:hypothetical protein BN1221_04830 [Brenneria goodwinii]|uniref:Uncharacterized protein n=1 Tax=Brenneria goodwinii TaxID=1109412 RepID=A0A0G4K2G3_9GAMM|nr:hypothetical protein BN1221_04830 [Brenneria goodwinii]